MARDYKTSVYTKTIAIREEDLNWIRQHKFKKSAAGFLEEIIKQYKLLNKEDEK